MTHGRNITVHATAIEGDHRSDQQLHDEIFHAMYEARLHARLIVIEDQQADKKADKVRAGDNIYAQTPAQAEALNRFIEREE